MTKTGKRKSGRSTRAKLFSPGRPPVWQRETLCRFWRGIAMGLSSEEAAVEAGVSAPVGSRWFRNSGEMPATQLAPSAALLKSRNLTFADREEIALECVRGTGVCTTMRPPLAPVVSGARAPRGPRAGVALRRTLAADGLVAARTAAEILPRCLAHRDALALDDEGGRHGRRLAGKRRAPASVRSTWWRADRLS